MPEMIVRILGDTSQLEQSYRKATRDTQKFSKEIGRGARGALSATVAFKGFGRSIAFASGSFLTGAGLVAATKRSVSLASDLNEQMSKTSVVFGKSADDVKQWSQDTASSMGLAQNEALGVASSFGALFGPLKIVGQQAATQSERLTQLGADLASFYNTSVQDALDAIRSGLVGESEPLRRYGVLLSETRVQQEALRETGKKHANELTNQEKVLARIALIYKDTKKAQGDFARTSGGLANQTRILNANVKQLGITVGQTLVPALSKAAKFANEFLQTISQPVEENATVSPAERYVLVPKLAHQYEIMQQHGIAAADAIKFLNRELGDSQKGALLVAEAIHYAGDKSLESVTKIAKLRGQLQGFSVDAETAAKAAYGVGIGLAQRAAARPRGLAAVGPGQRLRIALEQASLTKTTADDLSVYVRQRELYAKQIQSLQNRLSRATGKKARDLAKQLEQVYADDAAAYDQITSIQQAGAAKAAAAAQKAKDARQKALQHVLDMAQLRIDRDALTKTLTDDIRDTKAFVDIVKKQIQAHGATLERLQTLLQSQLSLRGLETQQIENRQAALAGKQFKALGLTATGDQRTRTRKWLKRRLAQVARKISGTEADTPANRAKLARIALVLNTWSTIEPGPAQEIQRELDDIAGEVSTGNTMPISRFAHVSPAKLAARLGLQGNRAAIGILAQYGAGGSMPRRSGYALGGAGGVVVVHNAHFHGVQDVKGLQNEMQKLQRGKPSNRRGAR